jgi:uncharacterized protein (DUF427 family)
MTQETESNKPCSYDGTQFYKIPAGDLVPGMQVLYWLYRKPAKDGIEAHIHNKSHKVRKILTNRDGTVTIKYGWQVPYTCDPNYTVLIRPPK